MSRNRLDRETSPYLLEHAANPVHWQPWDEAALGEARREGKPILLSIGYSACHWCHVMAHESFEDPEIAAQINAAFVAIKVDREERPDLDALYQNALALLGEPGGWPLTMFLTPQAEPFWGGTYFPPTSRYGRPGLRDVLTAVHATFHHDPSKVARNRTALTQALAAMAATEPGGALTPATIDAVATRLLAELDPVHGGLGGAPKFPHVPALALLWRAYYRTGQRAFADAVVLSLRNLCQGGIYDHLGGGFARYAVDARWLIPHFEKMLYDNAQLLELLAAVAATTGEPLFRTRAEETVAWLIREMRAPEGGFAAALDADSEGREGAFYVWTEAEIDAVLGPDAALFKAVYGVVPAGNWEGRTILNRLDPAPSGVDESALAAARTRLLAARDRRPRPRRDDKVLADWNGLMIAALATAGTLLDRSDWVALAARVDDEIEALVAADGRLRHSYRAGQTRGLAILDDHAALARAAIALYEATGEARHLDRARAHVAEADARFRDPQGGGYFLTAADAPDLIVRLKTAIDGATPAGNAVMVEVLARLYALTADVPFRTRADEIVGAFAAQVPRAGAAFATLLNAAELLEGAVQVVVVGDPDQAASLRAAALAAANPNRVLALVPAGDDLTPGHPAAGKGPIDGAAAAYVCSAGTCSLPITEPAALARALGGPIGE